MIGFVRKLARHKCIARFMTYWREKFYYMNLENGTSIRKSQDYGRIFRGDKKAKAGAMSGSEHSEIPALQVPMFSSRVSKVNKQVLSPSVNDG